MPSPESSPSAWTPIAETFRPGGVRDDEPPGGSLRCPRSPEFAALGCGNVCPIDPSRCLVIPGKVLRTSNIPRSATSGRTTRKAVATSPDRLISHSWRPMRASVPHAVYYQDPKFPHHIPNVARSTCRPPKQPPPALITDSSRHLARFGRPRCHYYKEARRPHIFDQPPDRFLPPPIARASLRVATGRRYTCNSYQTFSSGRSKE